MSFRYNGGTAGLFGSKSGSGCTIGKLNTHQKRPTLRGMKRCPACGQMNGNRSMACRNLNCALRKQALEQKKKKSIDPIQLISFTETKFYSVRSKEREFAPRNFVQITDITLISEETSSIVRRNAICYVDTCKYDPSDVNISCKHVNGCSSSSKLAEEFEVSHDVLWNLTIGLEQKMRLWEMYKEDETTVPPVQRINISTFVVKCTKSQSFPAGRLHVTALTNKDPCKKGTYSCACKKLKIVLSPNNSVVVKEEICDHLLLVLAGVLSKIGSEEHYSNFTNELKAFWKKELTTGYAQSIQVQLDQDVSWSGLNAFPQINNNAVKNECLDSVSAVMDANADDDIFIFDNDLLSNDDLSDFPENMLKSVVDHSDSNNLNSGLRNFCHQGDPNLVSSCFNIDDFDMPFKSGTKTAADAIVGMGYYTDPENDSSTHLELSDCNIELMDQFQLTDQIDLCNNEIILSDSDLFQGNSIIMPDLGSDSLINNCIDLPTVTNLQQEQQHQQQQQQVATDQKKESNYNSNTSLLKSNTQVNKPAQSTPLAGNKPLVVQKKPILTEVKPPFRKTLNSFALKMKDKLKPIDPGPALGYSAWLDYVIETINMSVDFEAKERNVCHTFHIHEEVFSHFSKSFSTSVKRRMPTNTSMMKKGKYKGLIKYSWVFHTPSTIQRIFTTKNVSIEIERKFESSCDGYIPYVRKIRDSVEAKYKRIYPKLSLYMAYIWFDCSNNDHKNGFKIDWLPNAFPKSRFGVLNIEFSLGFKKPS